MNFFNKKNIEMKFVYKILETVNNFYLYLISHIDDVAHNKLDAVANVHDYKYQKEHDEYLSIK